MSTPDAQLIPTAEAARMLNESVRQVNRRVQRGELEAASKLPGLRGARLFDRAVIAALTEKADA
jgi:hypothetical protein